MSHWRGGQGSRKRLGCLDHARTAPTPDLRDRERAQLVPMMIPAANTNPPPNRICTAAGSGALSM